MPDDQAGIVALKLDVTDAASAQACIAEIMRRSGRIDVLVNNAGYGIIGAIEETSVDQVRALFETNVFGAIRMAQAVIPIMRRQGHGRIINMSSVLGFLPAPFSGYYSASKHALEGFSESLDHELRHLDVRSVLVEPAYTATPFADGAPKADTPVDVYADVRRHMDRLAAEETAGGDDPDVVARAIVKIAAARNPKVRYPVGKQARTLATLRRFVPASAFEKSFRKQFGLDKHGARAIA